MTAIEQVYPVEIAGPPKLVGQLRPYQAQSLAFMHDIETSTDDALRGTFKDGDSTRYVRGGWLTDEMGMGKTAVCAALILGRLSTVQLDEKAFADLKNRTERQTKFVEGGVVRSREFAWMTEIDEQQYAGSGRATDFVRPDEWMIPQIWVPSAVSNGSGLWRDNVAIPKKTQSRVRSVAATCISRVWMYCSGDDMQPARPVDR